MKLLTTLTFALTLAASAQTPILAKLDAAAANFKSAQADVKYDNYTRVVRDHALQTGSLYIERNGARQSMGAVFFDPGNATPAKVLNYDGGTLRMYSPGTNQVDIFKAGDNQAKYESFLTLGFGGSGTALAKAWNINDLGPETVDNIKTEKLDLVSKDPSVANTFSHVTLWIDPARGLSLKQVFYAPNGDTRTALYTNIRLNASIDKKPYAISRKAQPIQH